MAVLLEGINIPEGNPITINIYRDGTWVNAYTTEYGKAVSVSEPHGRLGDLDALKDKWTHKDLDLFSQGWSWLRDLNQAPTVIPASKEG